MPGLATIVAVLLIGSVPGTGNVDYGRLWGKASPFAAFLETVKARGEQWRSRFANAAIGAAALSDARALPGRRRILVVADGRCSDSAWVVPQVAKLAAAVPEKLELRVLSPTEGRQLQSAHLTPDGRLATPTIVVLDEQNRYIGAWVERPSELQSWYVANKNLETAARDEQVEKWHADDAGRSTVREVLDILRREPAEGK